MRRFENSSTKKYWTIVVNGSTVETETGRIGSSNRPKVKHFPDAASAKADAARQIENRLERGFTALGAGSARLQPAKSLSPSAPTPTPTPTPAPAPTIAATGDHSVTLTACGPRKIMVIKTIREFTGLGLKDSKDLADDPPSVLKTAMSIDEAHALVAAIAEAGGTAAIDGQAAATNRAPSGDAFNVVLVDTGARKISVIKTIREFTGLGLKHSKDLADHAPSIILTSVDAETAERCGAAIAEAGGRVQLEAGAPPAGSPDEVTLVLTETGSKKIEIIKLIRYASGMGLRDSKDIADAPPGVISDRMSRTKAEDFLEKIRNAGGDARIDD